MELCYPPLCWWRCPGPESSVHHSSHPKEKQTLAARLKIKSYVITNLPPGFYTLSAEAPGFQNFQSTDNKLDPSGHLSIDVTVSVGSATQIVQVTASTATLQTESSTVQGLITRQQIDSLELNGRNPIWLAALAPGGRRWRTLTSVLPKARRILTGPATR